MHTGVSCTQTAKQAMTPVDQVFAISRTAILDENLIHEACLL
jgi:hypothetical protein